MIWQIFCGLCTEQNLGGLGLWLILHFKEYAEYINQVSRNLVRPSIGINLN